MVLPAAPINRGGFFKFLNGALVMDRKSIEERKKQLQAGIEGMTRQIQELQASIHANNGAIQDCDHWLRMLEGQEESVQDLGTDELKGVEV
jgi:TolA-binding protein